MAAPPSPAPAPGKGQHKFQAPKGTRDFYPADMAVRRYIENVWRQTSINHGFEEVEGPMFEHTELYTHKSGPGIVSEIFGVFSGKDEAERAELQKTGRAPYALRPEFTPTLARMVAARADALPKPIKWFAIPQHFRAERPQRGRLREFVQWNVDFIGDESPAADAEVIAVAVGAMERAGLSPNDVRVKISNRNYIAYLLEGVGVNQQRIPDALALIDRKQRISAEEYLRQATSLGVPAEVAPLLGQKSLEPLVEQVQGGFPVIMTDTLDDIVSSMEGLLEAIEAADIVEWCEFDHSVVRGLAYYTGTVFEIIAEGERAVAGGGRYDNLIESFGGPKLPACGFGMGDVVLGLLLKEKGLLKDEDVMRSVWPHAFVISSGAEVAEKEFRPLVARLRRVGLHVRHSYKSTKNIGKLLGEADKAGARFAVILDDALSGGIVKLKDLRGGEQREVKLDELEATLRECARQ